MIRSRDQLVLQGLWALWFCILFIPIFFQISELELSYVRIHLLSICHQKTERFFAFYSYLPLVCSRCMGIYLGLFLFGFFRWKQTLWINLVLIIVPFATDKFLEHSGFFTVGNTLRFISGLLMALGFTGIIYSLRTKTKSA